MFMTMRFIALLGVSNDGGKAGQRHKCMAALATKVDTQKTSDTNH